MESRRSRLMPLVPSVFFAFSLASWCPASAGESKTTLIPRTPASKESVRPLPPETALTHITLKFHEGTHVRLRSRTLVALDRSAAERGRLSALSLSEPEVDRDIASVRQIIALAPQTRGLARLFQMDEEVLSQRKTVGETLGGRQLADLDLYYKISLAARATAGEVADLLAALNALASVEIAYAVPPAEPASLEVTAAASTPDFLSLQGYLFPAPQGIDAFYAWTTPGGKGFGVKVVDVEGAWRITHEDLPFPFHTGVFQFDSLDWRNHGTAVAGEITAKDNFLGVTGISNQVDIGYESIAGQSVANAVNNAALAAGSGGIVLIELHAPGPANSSPCTCNASQCDFIAMEYWQDIFDVIATTSANGTMVVEAAGNGSSNLDDSAYGGAFDRNLRDSGAILVAASLANDRSPTCWTNWGSRIDLHGWGENVVTLGYGDLYNGGSEDSYYTSFFGGTSSASPIVTGAAAIVQGVSRASSRGTLLPGRVRRLLVETGTPQVPGAKKIGPMPDLRKAVNRLQTDQPPTASFAVSCSSLSCTFNNTSTDDHGFTSSWTFGDSSSASTSNASHTYAASGHYTVTLTVTDTLGAQASKSRLIPVSDQPLEFGVQHLGLYIGGTAGAVTDAQMIPADFNGDGYDDVLVFRSSDGSFRKWYGGSGVTQGFSEQPLRYIGGSPGAVAGAQMIPADFNGDGKTDFLVFRSSDGAYWKWYGDPGVPYPDFAYQPGRYIGGSPGAVPGAQMIPADFNGDGKTDFIVFRSPNGAYWKWYGDPGAPYPDFVFQLGRYIDGAPGAVTDAQMIPADFSGDGKSDVVVFRSADGSFRKWYGDTGLPGPDFSTPQPVTYIGGAPGAVTDAQMIPADFDGNGTSDILVFRPATGSFWKWYGDAGAPYPHFGYQLGGYVNDAPGEVTGAQMISADFNGDLRSDFLVFRSSDGAFWKWYSLGANIGPDFIYAYAPRYLGGSPGAVSDARMIPTDFNGDGKTDVLVFQPSNGAYWKWYGP